VERCHADGQGANKIFGKLLSRLIVLEPFAQERDVATEMEMGLHRAQGVET
jgi:hypothetical protein